MLKPSLNNLKRENYHNLGPKVGSGLLLAGSKKCYLTLAGGTLRQARKPCGRGLTTEANQIVGVQIQE